MSAQPRKSDWFTFQNLTLAVGMLLTASASYSNFRESAGEKIGRLEERIDALKDRVDRLERAK